MKNETKNISLVLTCNACPEQYDAYLNNELIGYLRLRYGCFSVYYPNSGGEIIYHAYPKGDGIFDCNERDYFLNKAKIELIKKIKREEKYGINQY